MSETPHSNNLPIMEKGGLGDMKIVTASPGTVQALGDTKKVTPKCFDL